MSNNQDILIVSEYFYPSNNSTSYYLTSIAEKLEESHSLKIICNTNLNDNIEKNDLNIIRINENHLTDKNIFLRALKYFITSLKLTFFTYKNINTNTEVLAVTNPAFLILFLGIIKKFKHFKYTILVYDVFPENLIAANILKKESLPYKLIKKLFDWAYSKADRLVVIGRDMEEVLQKKTNNRIPITIIENWCDYKNIIPTYKTDNKIIKSLNLENKKVFLFAGNLGRVQGIDNVLKAAEMINNPNFILLFIGDGAMKSTIKKHINDSQNKNVLYAGSYPINEQNTFLNACDIALVSLADSMYGLGVPSKSYFNMAAAKPILYIGNKESEIAKVINENKIGWVVESSNPLKLSECFNNLLKDDFSNYQNIGKKAREILIQNYSKEIILNKYKELYK